MPILAAVPIAIPAPRQPLELVRVIDGDTIEGLLSGTQTRIRLCGIDAPEKKQPLGTASTAALRTLLTQLPLTVAITDRDLYGRSIGSVYAGSIPVAPEMARQGMAYHYSQYSKKCPDLATIIAAENQARAAKAGVWLGSSIAPWDYRKLN